MSPQGQLRSAVFACWSLVLDGIIKASKSFVKNKSGANKKAKYGYSSSEEKLAPTKTCVLSESWMQGGDREAEEKRGKQWRQRDILSNCYMNSETPEATASESNQECTCYVGL